MLGHNSTCAINLPKVKKRHCFSIVSYLPFTLYEVGIALSSVKLYICFNDIPVKNLLIKQLPQQRSNNPLLVKAVAIIFRANALFSVLHLFFSFFFTIFQAESHNSKVNVY